jgi:hypothetical protein
MAKHIARTVGGFGTDLFGKRDYQSDGSWITTKWSVVGYMPMAPICSYRVRRQSNDEYEVLWEGKSVKKQVLCVYSYLYGPILLAIAAGVILGQNRVESIGPIPDYAWATIVALYGLLPPVLRSKARIAAGISLFQKVNSKFR